MSKSLLPPRNIVKRGLLMDFIASPTWWHFSPSVCSHLCSPFRWGLRQRKAEEKLMTPETWCIKQGNIQSQCIWHAAAYGSLVSMAENSGGWQIPAPEALIQTPPYSTEPTGKPLSWNEGGEWWGQERGWEMCILSNFWVGFSFFCSLTGFEGNTSCLVTAHLLWRRCSPMSCKSYFHEKHPKSHRTHCYVGMAPLFSFTAESEATLAG